MSDEYVGLGVLAALVLIWLWPTLKRAVVEGKLDRLFEALAGSVRLDGAVTLNVALTLNDAAANGAAVSALMRHPANAHLDRTVTLTPAGDGAYTASIADLPAGQWDAEITVSRDGAEVFQERTRLWLP